MQGLRATLQTLRSLRRLPMIANSALPRSLSHTQSHTSTAFDEAELPAHLRQPKREHETDAQRKQRMRRCVCVCVCACVWSRAV
jgi:hypothetical protein